MDTKALRDLSYGVFVIGTKNGEKLTGCAVNSVMQVVSEPPIIAVCINQKNFTNECIKKIGLFSISILSQEAKGGVIGQFGFKSGRDINKFDEISYELTKDKMPVLKDGITGWLSCKVIDKKELSTHTLFFAELTDAKQIGGEAMTYAYYHKVIKGKSPSTAPTYQKEEAIMDEKSEGVWICAVCGYKYDGSEGKFEDLPDDWKCPICGVGKEQFKLEK